MYKNITFPSLQDYKNLILLLDKKLLNGKLTDDNVYIGMDLNPDQRSATEKADIYIQIDSAIVNNQELVFPSTSIMSDKMSSGSVYEGEMSVLIKSYKQAIKINNQSISTFTYIKNISSLIRRAFTNNLFPYTLIDKNGTSTTCKNTYFNIMQTSKTSGDVGRIMVQALLKFRYRYREDIVVGVDYPQAEIDKIECIV